MRKILSSLLLMALMVFPAIADDDWDCESPTSCTTCKQPATWLPAECTDVEYSAYCSCRNNPTFWLDCESWDSCEYTGTPPCPNPEPSGECPDVEWFASPGEADEDASAQDHRFEAEDSDMAVDHDARVVSSDETGK